MTGPNRGSWVFIGWGLGVGGVHDEFEAAVVGHAVGQGCGGGPTVEGVELGYGFGFLVADVNLPARDFVAVLVGGGLGTVAEDGAPGSGVWYAVLALMTGSVLEGLFVLECCGFHSLFFVLCCPVGPIGPHTKKAAGAGGSRGVVFRGDPRQIAPAPFLPPCETDRPSGAAS